MSLIQSIRQKLGLSVTPANNFTWDASADNGTLRLYRGNPGAPIQDLLTFDVNGRASLSQNNIACSGTSSSGVTVPGGSVWTQINLGTVIYDTASMLNTGTGIITVPVAGLYLVAGLVSYASNGLPSGAVIATAAMRNVANADIGLLGAQGNSSGVLLYPVISGSQVLQLAAGSTIKLGSYQASGSNAIGVTGRLDVALLYKL